MGSREATWNNVIGKKSQDTLKLRTVLRFRNNFCSLFTHVNKILSIPEFRGKNIFLWFFFQLNKEVLPKDSVENNQTYDDRLHVLSNLMSESNPVITFHEVSLF